MIDATARKPQTRLEVIGLQVGHLFENLRRFETGREEVQNIAHTNAHPADARTSAALFWIDGDTVE